MNISNKFYFFSRFFQAIVFKRRFPLIVSWNITYKCNLRCCYCAAWEKKSEEKSTREVFSLIDELVNSGTKFISFSGGEPLLRQDFREIVDFCIAKNTNIGIQTNGMLVKDNIEIIKKMNMVQLSLDGPEKINDIIRGNGTYAKTMEAIDICKRYKIPFIVTTVISKINIKHISYLIELGKKNEFKIYFQPVDRTHSGGSKEDVNLLFGAKIDEYQNIIDFLIKEKRNGNSVIKNSVEGLRHIYNWPIPTKIDCLLSRVSCVIEPDHKIFLCDTFADYEKYLVDIERNFKETFKKLSFPYTCNRCWGGFSSDINLLKNMNIKTLLEVWKSVNKSL